MTPAKFIVSGAAALLLAFVVAAEPSTFDSDSFFRLEQSDGVWWFITPDGDPFLSYGVNHMTWRGDRARGTDERRYMDAVLAKYGTAEAWAEAKSAELRKWGFNTVGAWSQPEMNPHLPRTPILHLTQNLWSDAWKNGRVPDFFAPAFEEHVRKKAESIAEHFGDPMVLGYFLDNELPWAPDHRKTPELFYGYAAMPADAPGKHALKAFFQDRYADIGAFNQVWRPRIGDWDELRGLEGLKPRHRKKARRDREAFTFLAASKYFEVTTNAVRNVDPGRLMLGCRFMPYTVPKAVVEAGGAYCDVISINYYEQQWGAKLYFWWKPHTIDRMPQRMDLRAFHDAGQRPLMVTEFTSRLKKKGHNTWPPRRAIQPVVRTQRKRIARFEKQVMSWMPQPWFVGAHWFQHADQPVEGRGDGENSVFGLVNIDDEPYAEFVEGVARVHRDATTAHAASSE